MIAFPNNFSQSFGDTFKTICTELQPYDYGQIQKCYDRKYVFSRLASIEYEYI